MKPTFKQALPPGAVLPASGRAARPASWPPVCPTPQTAVLPRAGLLLLRRAGGSCVEVDAGIVLLTAHGHADDIELRDGQCFIIPNDGLVIVEAIATAHLILKPCRPGAPSPTLDALYDRLPWRRLRAWCQIICGRCCHPS